MNTFVSYDIYDMHYICAYIYHFKSFFTLSLLHTPLCNHISLLMPHDVCNTIYPPGVGIFVGPFL